MRKRMAGVAASPVVGVPELHRLLAREAGGPPPRVLEAGWAARPGGGDFAGEAIPGAVRLDTAALETPGPAWRLRGLPELRAVVASLGIGPDTPVVIVAGRVITAARVWWVLRYAGLPDVRVLDGGALAWRAAALPTALANDAPVRPDFTGRTQGRLHARHDWLQARLAEPGAVCLVDLRSESEFTGQGSGYGYLEARGRIPGAVHGGDADDAAGLYVRPDGTLQDPAGIRALWIARGILRADGTPAARELVFTCGGGWRSSVGCLFAEWLGLPWRNHSGGWSGWSTRFLRDRHARGASPGWRQCPSGRSVTMDVLRETS